MADNGLAFKDYKVSIEGVTPLLMHNGRLADPTNPHARGMKEISSASRGGMSDDQFQAMSDLEWEGGMYHDDKGRPVIPGEMIEAALIGGAKKVRLGADAKIAVMCPDDAALDYDGPKDYLKLKDKPEFRDVRRVRIQKNAIMRTRPKFNKWGATLTIRVTKGTKLDDADKVQRMVEDAGMLVGVGDYRPRFGRFVVTDFKAI